MDVFALRDRVVDEYRKYVESFVNILDPQIDGSSAIDCPAASCGLMPSFN